MKKLFCCILLSLLSTFLYAQAPQQFSFQGIARNAQGSPIINGNIGLQFTITGGGLGVLLYQETHKAQTNAAGVFTVSVGGGTVVQGSFDNMKWRSETHFLQVQLDPKGGENYTDLGTTQLTSVPYALHSMEADRWKDHDPVIQKGEINSGAVLNAPGTGPRLIWYPRKAAFRAGYLDTSLWNDANIGTHSTAFGMNTLANATGAFATGLNTTASGTYSFAIGANTSATGDYSLAAGFGGTSNGSYSAISGEYVNAKARASVSFGSYNNNTDNPNSSVASFTDRIFQIGNGTNAGNRSNALTVLRNGNVGIGNNALAPQFALDVSGQARIQHNPGASATLWFNDSNNNAEGKVGMKNDNEIGFYNADKWLFWLDKVGNTYITGTTYNSSDVRLKRDFSRVSNSLSKLSQLDGYHYFWKNNTLDTTLQTGLIAQDVEVIFPELVKTDDKGLKSVNYSGLIPHLIEAVKELQASVEALTYDKNKLKAELQELKSQNAPVLSMQTEIGQLRDSLRNIEASLKSAESAAHTVKPSEK